MTTNIGLLWLDLETTGLDPKNDHILEAAWQLTNHAGTPASGGHSLPTSYLVKPSDATVGAISLSMLSGDKVMRDMHSESGLWRDLISGVMLDGREAIPLKSILNDLNRAVQDASKLFSEVRLAGSSVHFDRAFLDEVTDRLPSAGLSHRVHDMTAIRTLADELGVDYNLEVNRYLTPHRAADDVTRDLTQWRVIRQSLGLAGGDERRSVAQHGDARQVESGKTF